MHCPGCSTDNPPAARFCLHCGQPLTDASPHTCTQCGTPLTPQAKFCTHCGNPTSTDTPSSGRPENVANSFQALQRLLPSEYLQKLMAAKGQVVGERRVVTILFSDVKGSTALAEKLDPEEVLQIMNGAFEVLIEPITRYEGTLARLMGDAIMAFFGAPIAHEDDPDRACRAALEILHGASAYAQKLEDEKGVKGFNVRVGINTGLVVMAEVGADLRVEYTAMGDAVNLAARMESIAEPGTILLSEATVNLLGNRFNTTPLGPIEIKGKSEPVRVFKLLGVKDDLHEPEKKAEGIHSPLIGREAELDEMKASIRQLLGGKGGFVAVSGDTGLGKSRIIAEVKREVRDSLTWGEGKALAYTQSTSYWTARKVLRHLLKDTSQGRPSATDEAALHERIKQIAGEDLLDVYYPLSLMLGLPLEADVSRKLEHMDPETQQQKIELACRSIIRRVAEQKPTVLVWENLHWIDPSSQRLLESLLSLTTEVPLLLLFSYRAIGQKVSTIHSRCSSLYGDRYRHIQLKPLNETDSGALLDRLARSVQMSPELREQILQKTEGNAFYLEEVVRQIVHTRSRVAERPGHDDAERHGILSIPDTLRGVIMARIDALPQADRNTLQTASVLGRSFGKEILAHMMSQEFDSASFEQSLAVLQQHEFLQHDAGESSISDTEAGGDVLIFSHGLTQEVAYESLLLAQRRQHHRRAGEVMEEILRDHLSSQTATLANHFEIAGEKEKALRYLSVAAFDAKKIFAHHEAVNYFHRALIIATGLGTTEQQASLHQGIGDVYTLLTKYDSASRHYEKARTLAADALERAVLSRKLAQVFEKKGQYENAVRCFEESLGELRESYDPIETARVYTGLGRVYYHQGQLQSAMDLSDLALDLMKAEGDEWGTAQACNNFGIVYYKAGDYSKALDFHQRSLSIWESLGESYGLAVSHNNLGLVFRHQGNDEKALEHFRLSVDLCEKTGNQLGLARACDNLSQIYAARNNHEEAGRYLEKAVTILAAIGQDTADGLPEMWMQSGTW